MKALLKLFSAILLISLAGCSSTYYVSQKDDVYYLPQTVRGGSAYIPEDAKTVEVVDDAYAVVAEHQDTVEVTDAEAYYVDEDGQVIIIQNFYGDHYDFAYASRIRRFHRSYVSFGYFDPFYTNMFYYTYNPYHFGASIYLGFGPSPWFFGGYYGYYPMSFYNPFWHHYYWRNPWFYGPGSYWAGYHHGFYTGFGYGIWHPYYFGYGGYSPWGGPMYPQYGSGLTYHYGPRGTAGGGTVGRPASGRETTGTRDMLATRPGETTQSVESQRGTAPVDPKRSSEQLVRGTGDETATTTMTRERMESMQNTHREEMQRAAARQQTEQPAAQRYTRPQQTSPERVREISNPNYSMPRTYTSPSYRQPSTPQRTRPGTATPAPTNVTRPSRDQGTPSQPTQRPATQPSRTDRGQPSYTPPRQQPTRTTTSPPSTPSRSSASPSRSSTPSRSSAAPARSSSSSGSSAAPARSSGSSRSSSPPARSGGSSSSGGRNR
ncbi:MAG: hypothetical protein RG741_01730 [Bacteroidales bacterium]|nr:hypothetical protein [Bacteroidales bacterium]